MKSVNEVSAIKTTLELRARKLTEFSIWNLRSSRAHCSRSLSFPLSSFSFRPRTVTPPPTPRRASNGSDWAESRGPGATASRGEESAGEMVDAGREPGLESALRRALGADRHGRARLSLQLGGRGRDDAGAGPRLDADTGKKIWEYRFNVYSTDVPPRRIAWSSPAGDPATGNVYAFGASNELVALSNDGKLLWSRSLTDEFGAWTTHGGRTVSPVIEGDWSSSAR